MPHVWHCQGASVMTHLVVLFRNLMVPADRLVFAGFPPPLRMHVHPYPVRSVGYRCQAHHKDWADHAEAHAQLVLHHREGGNLL